LHDRAFQNQPLSPEERAELEAWYAWIDAEAAARMKKVDPLPERAELRHEIEANLIRVAEVTRQIQTLMAENDALRAEINRLKEELARTSPRGAHILELADGSLHPITATGEATVRRLNRPQLVASRLRRRDRAEVESLQDRQRDVLAALFQLIGQVRELLVENQALLKEHKSQLRLQPRPEGPDRPGPTDLPPPKGDP
jgi:cell division protein FtsB